MKRTPTPLKYIGLANTLELDAEGWALIPYGDSRHSGRDAREDVANAKAKDGKAEIPVIQRFDRSSAEALVNDFRSAAGAIKRAIVGLPIFKGHPDATRFAKIWPDKTPRGTIADMEATDKGLRFRPVLTEQGADEVRNGWSDFSPYWLLNKVGEENGTPIVSPFLLKSIGLCPRGNIPGLSLVNAGEDEDESNNPMYKELLLKLLAALKIKVAADADDAALANAVESANPVLAAANAAETQLATVKGEKTESDRKLAAAEESRKALETEKVALVNAKTGLEAEVATLKTSVASERKERATLIVNAAIVDGRVTAADRETTITALCNAADFAAEADKIAKRAKVLPTTSVAKKVGETRASDAGKADKVLALVNARMESQKEDYETAFLNVQRTPEYKAIFEGSAK